MWNKVEKNNCETIILKVSWLKVLGYNNYYHLKAQYLPVRVLLSWTVLLRCQLFRRPIYRPVVYIYITSNNHILGNKNSKLKWMDRINHWILNYENKAYHEYTSRLADQHNRLNWVLVAVNLYGCDSEVIDKYLQIWHWLVHNYSKIPSVLYCT